VVSIFWFQPRYLARWLARWNPDVLFFIETDQKVIALTIDDSPHPNLTPRILDVLQRFDVRATFFVLGDRVAGNEEILTRMRAEGHQLGNHMMYDRRSILLSRERFTRNLEAADALIQPTGVPKWFRPGSGWFSGWMIEQALARGYRCCVGSIYPHDNKLRRPNWIARTVRERAYPGAIIVLHDGHPKREYVITVLEGLIPALQAKGYEFLTVSELYALK